jgi:hypothetical protein
MNADAAKATRRAATKDARARDLSSVADYSDASSPTVPHNPIYGMLWPPIAVEEIVWIFHVLGDFGDKDGSANVVVPVVGVGALRPNDRPIFSAIHTTNYHIVAAMTCAIGHGVLL